MPKKSEFYTIREALKLLGFTVPGVKRMRKAEQFRKMIQYEGCGLEALRHLFPFLRPQTMPELCNIPVEKRDSVTQKWLMLKRYSLRLYDLAKSEQIKARMLQRESIKDCGVPRRTLRRWQSRFRLNGISGLIDRRGGEKQCRKAVISNTNRYFYE